MAHRSAGMVADGLEPASGHARFVIPHEAVRLLPCPIVGCGGFSFASFASFHSFTLTLSTDALARQLALTGNLIWKGSTLS